MGRLTADAELKTTSNGIEVTSFQLAVNRQMSKEKTADFIPCTAWRQPAAFVNKYFHKGDMIAVEGSLQSRNYEDKDGKKRTAYDVQVSQVHFCGGKKNDDNSTHTVTEQTQPAFSPDIDATTDNDDLPF